MKDYEVIQLTTDKDVKDYLEYRKATDIWVNETISNLRVIAAPNDCFSKEEKEIVFHDDVFRQFLKEQDVRGSEQSALECVQDTGLFLSLDSGTYPIRRVGLSSLYSRAKISGQSITAEVDSSSGRCLPLTKKARILSQMLGLYDAKCKILYRDEKISAILSEQYAILPEYKLYEVLEKVLSTKFSNHALLNGTVSHEHFSVNFVLHDDDMEEDMDIRLQEGGIDYQNVQFVLSFLTSDIGNANATVYPYVVIDDAWISLGDPIKIKHFGKNTVKDFSDAIQDIYSLFETASVSFKALGQMHINYPGGCLRTIGYKKKLPKKIVMGIAAELDMMHYNGCNGFDILLALSKIFEAYKEYTVCGDFTRNLAVQENVARAMKLDFSKYDKEFDWEKGDSIEF